MVKNITDYGAFVDLGGIDGLLHVTDMSWKRVNHPSQVLAVGDTVKVQIVKINPDTQRISLGMKQLQSDPWDGVEAKYPVGAKFTGRITNITDYGAFVELEAGVEGLVHVSEMSWTKKNVHPGKIVSTSQEVEVVVLDVDASKRRVSLGLKQAMANPWDAFVTAHPIGSTVEGEVKNATEFGLFIGLDNDIDGMVHLSDIDWSDARRRSHRRATRRATWSRPRCSTSTSRRSASRSASSSWRGDPMAGDTYRKGQTVTVTVTEITSGGIEVKFGEDEAPMTAFIRKSDLSRDRAEQRPERFAVGDRLDAQITNIDKAARRVSLSVKALEMAEDKEADREVRLVGLGRLARRHPGRGPAREGQGRVSRRLIATLIRAALARPPFRAPLDHDARLCLAPGVYASPLIALEHASTIGRRELEGAAA